MATPMARALLLIMVIVVLASSHALVDVGANEYDVRHLFEGSSSSASEPPVATPTELPMTPSPTTTAPTPTNPTPTHTNPTPTIQPLPTPPVPTTPSPPPSDPPSPSPVTPPATPSTRPTNTPSPSTKTPPSPPSATTDDAISPSPVPRLPSPSNDGAASSTTTQPTQRPTMATVRPSSGSVAADGSGLLSGDSSSSSSLSSSSSGSNSLPSSSSSSSSSSSTASLPSSSSASQSSSGPNEEANNALPSPSPTQVTTTTISSGGSSFHDVAVYVCMACTALSIILLLLFHVVAFDASSFDWPYDWVRANGWELLLYVGYLQQLTSLSHLELTDTPPSLWQFTDAFSWSNFLIQHSKLTTTTTAATSSQRRLQEAAIYGIDAFAARIETSSSSIFLNAVVGVAVLFAVIFLVFVALCLCGKKPLDDKFDVEGSIVSAFARSGNSSVGFSTRRRGALCVLGFGVILWFLALYPLTAFATFDLASASSSTTALAIIVLALFGCVMLIGLAVAIIPQSEERLLSSNSLRLYGALYADTTHGFRWFFIVTALAQIALGVCVGAVHDDGEAMQLTVVVIIVVGYLVTVLLCSPFTSQTPLYCTAVVCVLKIVNYSLAFAFVSSKDVSLSGRERAADTIIVMNMVVLLLWLVRLLFMLVTFIRLYAERREAGGDTQTPQLGRRSIKDDTSVTNNGMRPGSGVYVTMMVSPPQTRLGSEFEEPDGRRTGRLAMAL